MKAVRAVPRGRGAGNSPLLPDYIAKFPPLKGMMMNQISTNNTNPHLKNDYFGNELEKYGKNSNVLIAAAFFTNSRFIKDLVDNGCNVKLIVRLAPATNAQELKQILRYKNKVDVRYYTSSITFDCTLTTA